MSAHGKRTATVLVVDDEPDVRVMLQEFLEGLGYTVRVAETAIGALGLVRTAHPDVVLLDLSMPGAVTGVSVVTAIAAEAPVIVVTAIIDADVARRTLQDGAFDFIMKPFNLTRVAEVIDAALAAGRPPGSSRTDPRV